jgi:hypothetical protein
MEVTEVERNLNTILAYDTWSLGVSLHLLVFIYNLLLCLLINNEIHLLLSSYFYGISFISLQNHCANDRFGFTVKSDHLMQVLPHAKKAYYPVF